MTDYNVTRRVATKITDRFSSMLRCKEDTQYESRVVANQISNIMGGLYPVSWQALTKGETDE